MIELLTGTFKYEGFEFSIEKFEDRYFGKVNNNGKFENFSAKDDNEAIQIAKKIIDKIRL